MVKKTLLLVTILALALVSGAVNVFAADDDDTSKVCLITNTYEGVMVPAYCDGRINAFDIAQPVAIYYTYEDVEAVNDDGETYPTQQITGIALWGIDADSNGYLALWVGTDAINAAMAAGGDAQLGAAHGFTLNYSAAWDQFWITGPDYTFTWDAW